MFDHSAEKRCTWRLAILPTLLLLLTAACGQLSADEYQVDDSTQTAKDNIRPCLRAAPLVQPEFGGDSQEAEARTRRVEQVCEAEQIQLGCERQDLRLVGRQLKAAFESHAPQYVLNTELGTREANLAKLQDGSLDLVLSSMPLAFRHKKRGLEQYAIATVVMAAYVPVSNPLWGLSRGQLADLMSGVTTQWSLLTRMRFRVQVLDCERNDPFLDLALTRLFPGRKLTADATHLGTISRLEARIMQEPGSISLLPFTENRVAGVKMLAVDGVLPLATTIRTGRYPLTYRLYLVSRKRPNLASLKAISFVTGSAGRRLLADLSLIVN